MMNSGRPILPPGCGKKGKSKSKQRWDASITSYPHDIHLLKNFLTAQEAQQWVTFAEKRGFERMAHPATSEHAHRYQWRLTYEDLEAAAALYSRLRDSGLLPREINGMHPHSCSSNIRVYKYEKGDSFGKHIDESVNYKDGSKSVYTLLVYMQSPLPNIPGPTGGETCFYDYEGRGKTKREKEVVRISAGDEHRSLLLHRHGENCLLHEALEVTNGIKYVLRSDVIYSNSI